MKHWIKILEQEKFIVIINGLLLFERKKNAWGKFYFVKNNLNIQVFKFLNGNNWLNDGEIVSINYYFIYLAKFIQHCYFCTGIISQYCLFISIILFCVIKITLENLAFLKNFVSLSPLQLYNTLILLCILNFLLLSPH